MPEPDAFTECLEIMTCNNNDNDCPGNAMCLHNQCMCPEPNIGDDCRRKYFNLVLLLFGNNVKVETRQQCTLIVLF